jgi:hypothetical protein
MAALAAIAAAMRAGCFTEGLLVVVADTTRTVEEAS